MPVLTINGKQIEVPEGSSVLDAINESGIYISQLCKDSRMDPIGACRTCLVQIEGQQGFPASCSSPATEGMEVQTETPDVRQLRKGVLERSLLRLLPGWAPVERDLVAMMEETGMSHPLEDSGDCSRWLLPGCLPERAPLDIPHA